MALNTQIFFTRLGSAAVFSAIMLLAFLTNEWSFIALFFVVNILCLREYIFIVEKILHTQFSKNEKMNFILIGISTFTLICCLPINMCNNFISTFLSNFLFYFLGLSIGAFITFFIFKKNKKAIYLLTGIGYISLSLGLLVQIRFQSLLLPVIFLLFIWMNDTLAYLTGSFIGKTPFFPSISPKKTIEGTLGGIVFTMIFAATWGYFVDWFPMWQWITFGLIASIIGTIGDLIESKLKRLANIKDSGNLMPGHGGALDRFDSLLLVSSIAFLFCVLFVKCLEYIIW